MTLARYYLALLIAIAVLSLAACRESDVTPGNNPDAVLDDESPGPTTALAQNAAGNAQNAPSTDAAPGVQEADIMPGEFTRDGAEQPDRIAFATLQPTQGNAASGLVAFIQPDAGQKTVRVVGKIIGIPSGEHGMHIHETGNCTAPDASSAGAHYDPTGMQQHGDRSGSPRHLGDLGNIAADADQIARFDFTTEQVDLVSGPESIVTRALIVHASADDLSTQPSGNSGSPIACGVITPQENNFVPE